MRAAAPAEPKAAWLQMGQPSRTHRLLGVGARRALERLAQEVRVPPHELGRAVIEQLPRERVRLRWLVARLGVNGRARYNVRYFIGSSRRPAQTARASATPRRPRCCRSSAEKSSFHWVEPALNATHTS